MIVYRDPALQDSEFLLKLDSYPIREQYCKVIVLNFNEEPLHEITGQIVSGNLTVDGSSACRRTVSLQMITDDPNVNELDWQIATKYLFYIGLKNFVDSKYDDIIWFPQGLFIVTSISTTNNMQGITVSLQGKDKMCLLDGSVGGAVFADHDFGKIQTVDTDGTLIYEDIPMWRIIREAIHTYAHEPYENIIINDLEDISVELLDYKVRDQGAFIYDVSSDNTFSTYTSDLALDTDDIGQWFLNSGYQDSDDETRIFTREQRYYRIQKHLQYGDTAGYRRTELTYPGDLTIQAGGSITSMLDKIKQVLGEYEYFYDVYGRFIFQMKKLYNQVQWSNVDTSGFFKSSENSEYIYDLAYGQNVESYVNKPNLLNVRNDWVIWGKIGGSENEKYPCHLRYAIDDKPIIYHCLTDGYWYHTNNNPDPSQDEENICQFDKDSLVNDYIYANFGGGSYTDTVIESRIIQPCITAKQFKVDWRELIYRMAIDYSQAQSRVEVLTKARDKLPLLQIVDIHRLLNLYSSMGEDEFEGFITGYIKQKNGQGNYIYDSDGVTHLYVRYQNADRNTYYDISNADKPYYGFWIYDDNKKKFRHISIQDLTDANTKRLDKKQTLITWADWIKSCNKTIFFSLNSIEDTFNLGNITRANAINRIYDWYPVKGLGYTDNSSNSVSFTQRADAFIREIKMWEHRLSSRYEIYFADLLAFWPILYKTKNTLSELDLTQERQSILTKRANANSKLRSFDFSAGCSNYDTTVHNLLLKTDINDEIKNTRSRAAANTYWQTLVDHFTKIFGTDAANDLQIGGSRLNTIQYNCSETMTTVLTGYNAIDVYNSTPLQEWLNYIRSYLITQMTLMKPSTSPNASYPNNETAKANYETYKTNIENIQLNFMIKQGEDKRNLVSDAYQEWINNNYWDPDIIYYPTGSSDPMKFLSPESMLFWFDFMSATAELGKYKISVIGHRPKVVNDEKVKAIFFRDIPSVLFMEADEGQPEEHNLSYVYMQLSTGLAQYFQISSLGKSAKDELDTLLYNTTFFQDTITVSCLPIYYLEPNHLIRAADDKSGIRGKYSIKSFTISLAFDGMMSIQANKVVNRIS